MPDDISLGPVRLRVSDASRTAAWLERVLGLVPLAGVGMPPSFGTRGGVALVELHERPGARAVPERGLIGLYHYALLLSSRANLGSFLRHVLALGEPFTGSDHHFSEAIYLTDPDGIAVEVYADRSRDNWNYQDGQLVETSDPLVTAGVLAEGRDKPWHGAPDGTVMGHLHFYVRDLGVARRFHVDGLGFGLATGLTKGTLFVSAGGYHHHVGLNTWAAAQAVASPADAGLESWTLVVPGAPDRDAIAARLISGGVRVRRDGVGFEASDPWGITVRVVGE